MSLMHAFFVRSHGIGGLNLACWTLEAESDAPRMSQRSASCGAPLPNSMVYNSKGN